MVSSPVWLGHRLCKGEHWRQGWKFGLESGHGAPWMSCLQRNMNTFGQQRRITEGFWIEKWYNQNRAYKKINLAGRCRIFWKRLRSYEARAIIQIRNNRGLINNSGCRNRKKIRDKYEKCLKYRLKRTP